MISDHCRRLLRISSPRHDHSGALAQVEIEVVSRSPYCLATGVDRRVSIFKSRGPEEVGIAGIPYLVLNGAMRFCIALDMLISSGDV